MYIILGKLEIKKFTFTALGSTKDEVTKAITKAWTKHCQVEGISPYGKTFETETAFKAAIHYLQMEVGIAYRLYNNIDPFEKDCIKGNLEVSEMVEEKSVSKDNVSEIIEETEETVEETVEETIETSEDKQTVKSVKKSIKKSKTIRRSL